MSARITDQEWREYQAIPDQGYSHRAWLDRLIAEKVYDAREFAVDGEVYRVEPTSCRCGGSWAWMKQHDAGSWVMVGCVCHHLPGQTDEHVLVNREHLKVLVQSLWRVWGPSVRIIAAELRKMGLTS